MKFTWHKRWVPVRRFDPSRRSFLIGATATALLAPTVVRAELLMPVRKLIVPEPVALLTKRVVVSLEGSMDQENWFPIVRAVGGEGTVLRPENFPLLNIEPKFTRQIFTPEWKAEKSDLSPSNPKLVHVYERMAKLYKGPSRPLIVT
jgi:hypothetical protein